jgi:hypothetical protein
VNGKWKVVVLALADEIASYLESRPNAADTAEGILTWWLARQRYAETKRNVEQALEYLTEQGLVQFSDGPHGRIYSSARRRS